MSASLALLFVALTLIACSGRTESDGGDIPINVGPPSATPYSPECIKFCHDADGDGRGAGVTVSDGCEEEEAVPEPGFAVCHEDCNDINPDVFAGAAQDHDGDGYGFAGRPAECVGALPEGYAYGVLPRDCDDEDPNVRPGVPEQWLDGVDSDCNGEEDPNDCSADAFDEAPVEIDTSCGNLADLFVVMVFGCPTHCGNDLPYFVVANRGGSTIEGRAVLTATFEGMEPKSTTTTLTLEPGARSNPLALPSGGAGRFDVGIELESAPPECDRGNNTGQGSIRALPCN